MSFIFNQEIHGPLTFVIGALILAWILSLFGMDQFFVDWVRENYHGKQVTRATYYMIFFFVSLACGVALFCRDLLVANKINQQCDGCGN